MQLMQRLNGIRAVYRRECRAEAGRDVHNIFAEHGMHGKQSSCVWRGGGHIDARRMMANKINMQFEKEAEIHPD